MIPEENDPVTLAKQTLEVLLKIEAHLARISSLVKDSRWGTYIVTTELNPK